MEEKLYFKPAGYGKGIKKKEKPVKEKEDDERNHRVRNLVLFLLLIGAIVIIVIWLLHGRTTTTGQYPANIRNESLTCISKEYILPKMSYLASADREVKINAIFDDSVGLKNISLIYTLNYATSDEAYGAEAKGHALFNQTLGASGFSVNKFNNKFSRYNESLIVSLFAEKPDLDEFSAPYFALETNFPTTILDYKHYYESLGFFCKVSGE